MRGRSSAQNDDESETADSLALDLEPLLILTQAKFVQRSSSTGLATRITETKRPWAKEATWYLFFSALAFAFGDLLFGM